MNGTAPLKIAAVVSWPDRGKWLWEYLPDDADCIGELLLATPEPEEIEQQKRQGKKARPYFDEFRALARRRYPINDFDVIFCWEMRALVGMALYRRLTGQRRAKLVAMAPIFKGELLKVLPVLRALLSDVDRFVCVTSGERDHYADLLKMSPDRFTFVPLAWLPDEEEVWEDKGYVLSLGHSNRNYPLLLDAIEGTDIPLTIVASNDSFLQGRTIPPYVDVKLNTGHHETNDLIANAMFHVIPLHDVQFCSGTTVLLRAMARGKAVIVTDTMGLRDYVRDGETGILVPPDDVAALRSAILRLWSDAELRKSIGKAAAKSVREEFHFPGFARRMADLAKELMGK